MQQYVKAESVELLQSGHGFFDALSAAIDASQRSIHLQTYIFKEDEAGRLIGNKLIAAAKRGVQVYLLLDGYGSRGLSKGFLEEWTKAGIQFRFFSTLFSSENISLSRRLHHKVVVIDDCITFIGGINIGNHYRGIGETPAWLDFALMIRGGVAHYAGNICDAIYHKTKMEYVTVDTHGSIRTRLRRSDWLRRKNDIYSTYKYAITHSNESITLFASYFLPGYFFLRRLRSAVKRGVQVRIVTGSKSDIFLFHQAEKFLYPFLMRNGIEIYEWNTSVMHGKLGLFDGKLLTVGSYNLNNLSRYSCVELNVDVDDVEFGQQCQLRLDEIIQRQCSQITWDKWYKKNGVFKQLVYATGYYLYRFIMYLIAPRE